MSLLAHTPELDIAAADSFARDLYGIEVSTPTKQLDSERDQNFLIETSSGRFVLKVSNSAQVRENLDAQNEIIQRIGKAVQVVESLQGNLIEVIEVDNKKHLVRLVTYVEGRPMSTLGHYSDELLHHLGVTVGEMTNAMHGYDHPALHYDFHWDLANAVQVVESRLDLVADKEKRTQVELLLNRFKSHTLPLLNGLPQSVIHNDANDGNLIVEETDGSVVPNRIASIIDFGDSVWSWTIGELAIAMAYAILGQAEPLGVMCTLIDGYRTKRDITENEASALYGLVCMRLCTSVVMAAEQQRQRPDDLYLSVSQAPIAKMLPKLVDIPFEFAATMLGEHCGFAPPIRTKRVREWLGSNSKDIVFPVGESRPVDDKILVMDLGVESPHMLSGPKAVTEPELARVINDAMTEAGAEIVVGRYLEPRRIYTSSLFVTDDRADEDRTVHLGMDLFCSAGTVVRAPLAGEVFLFNDNDTPLDYGPLVILKHVTQSGDEFYSLYGHLERASLNHLEPGQKIKAGEGFAKLGAPDENGGWPPHLHFQVIVDLMELGTDFPGVCRPNRVAGWRHICLDPNLILQIPEELSPKKLIAASETLRKRKSRLGDNLSIGYRRPVKTVCGWMQYLYDENGQEFIDAYNNVPHVGHCHPRVVEALHSQANRLNTNTRYLSDGVLEFAEALVATMPDGLDVCYFLNSASEANELALRMSRTKTKAKDLVVLEGAYHGHSTSLIDISPYKHDGPGGEGAPDWVHTAPVADIYRGRFRNPVTAGAEYAGAVGEVLDKLKREGRRVSGFIAESCPSVGGQIIFPDGYLSEVYAHIRAAGGVCIADDVQTGYGRLGKWFYGFEQQNVIPDIVVLGKPIGNGHPIAAVVTTREIADCFANGMEFFSTFGGNTVSAAVGKTVLDVVHDESLPAHAEKVGNYLLSELRELKTKHPIIGDVRGSGLFLGLELVRDHENLEPADREASYIANRMRDKRILLGTDGPLLNVLKIRPPMPFDIENAKVLVQTLDESLSELN